MALLILLECLVLAEVLFLDKSGMSLASGGTALEIYFALSCATLVLQVAGIALVLQGRARLGGTLQIVASAPHVLKIEGIVGVVGGLRARESHRAASPG